MHHEAELGDDRAAISEVVLDYVMSWLTGDGPRMARALHQGLAKRTPVDVASGSLELDESPFDEMVVSAGRGPRPFPHDLEMDIQAIEGGIASASARSAPWLDLLHLAWFGDRWRIVNALYEPRAATGDDPADRAAVAAVLDSYVAAGFDDDVEAILRTHHPALVERRVVVEDGGRLVLEDSNLPEIVETVRRGLDMDRFPRTWDARILDLGRDIAAARVIAGWYDLHLHLARFGDRWLMVNIVYRVLEAPT